MYDVYESANHIHLVLELVTGGELFDRWKNNFICVCNGLATSTTTSSYGVTLHKL